MTYEDDLIKFKDPDGNIHTIHNDEEFDKAMSNPEWHLYFGEEAE